MRPIFKINGYYRTGTNWLAHLLRANVPGAIVFEQSMGQKHSVPTACDCWHVYKRMSDLGECSQDDYAYARQNVDTAIGILIAKSPAAFAVSYKRFNPECVLSSEIVNYSGFIKYSLERVAEYPNRWRTITYESLLENTASTLSVVAGRAVQLSDPVAQVVSAAGVRTDKAFDKKDYYLCRRYLADLSQDELAMVNDLTDWDTMRWFGYSAVEKEHANGSA